MAQRKSQQNPKLTHLGYYPTPLNGQALEDKSKRWFWKGLERFVNTGDSWKDYRDLSKAWPTFWPVNIEGRNRSVSRKAPDSLNWRDEGHQLFHFYRNTLRSNWTRNPQTSTNGKYINMLFGLDLPDERVKKCFAAFEYSAATTSFYPEWGAGVIRFVSNTDFQRAIWLLFCESWRAKICPSCSTYFIAEKSAQTYCGISCGNRAHRSNSLKWWRAKGANRRAARTLAKRRKK
jgi:hypothetical protein